MKISRKKVNSLFLLCFSMLGKHSSLFSENILRLSTVKEHVEVSEILSLDFLKNLKNVFQAKNFIETGTFLGRSTARASQVFQNVHTIELSKNLHKLASEHLKDLTNVTTHQGDSAKILQAIAESVEGKTLFWLDGHYSGPLHAGFETAKGERNTPVIEELYSIRRSGLKDAIIMIDDIRLFEIPQLPLLDPKLELEESDHYSLFQENFLSSQSGLQLQSAMSHLFGYPVVSPLITIIKAINPEYKIVILEDILVAFIDKTITVSPLVEACTISRLYDGSNYEPKQVFDAEKVIANASSAEKELLDELYRRMGCDNYVLYYGIGKHYTLWEALTLIHTEPLKAYGLLKDVYTVGLRHWRIKAYMAQALTNANPIKHKALIQALKNECLLAQPDFELLGQL